MRIILFGGTTEAGEAIPEFLREGYEVSVSVATKAGREALKSESFYDRIRVISGRKEEEELKELLSEYDACIDATHPYAERITKNLKKASALCGIRYYRLLREGSEVISGLLTDEDPEAGNGFELILAENMKEAAEILKERLLNSGQTEGNILLTTGSKELSPFLGLEKGLLYARVLPTRESIESCEKNGIPDRNIIALWGPFTKELNLALIRQYHIRYLVTKESGKEGGFSEKAAAAKEAGCILIVIKRPKEKGDSLKEILYKLKESEQ